MFARDICCSNVSWIMARAVRSLNSRKSVISVELYDVGGKDLTRIEGGNRSKS